MQQSSQKNQIDLYEQEIICVQIFASDARVMCVDKKRDVGARGRRAWRLTMGEDSRTWAGPPTIAHGR